MFPGLEWSAGVAVGSLIGERIFPGASDRRERGEDYRGVHVGATYRALLFKEGA